MTRTAVAPGNHDGVHLGHRRLVAEARAHADANGLATVALFFDPHPAAVLTPDRAPPALTTVARRIELLRGAGADDVAVHAFDLAFAALGAAEFVAQVLVAELRAAFVVVGPDFRFGHGREGDVARLAELGRAHDFAVRVAEPVVVDGSRVSSTRIRGLLGDGATIDAARLLGRLHDADATVVRGAQRGRTLGFPTANLACDPVVLPRDGVYAVLLRTPDGAARPAVASLGARPTFDAGATAEVHVLDFDGDLYDARVRVAFGPRLRDMARFDGIDALRAAIAADVDAARAAIANLDPELCRCL